ncbi:sensor histidine kinase [Glycomyces sp. NPDC046736]|uniref:sensor histidine kinase n=1 Tax=Glycomyces sp. NPDC046736 TaxID=3155615 RepID=UPI0033D94A87
MAEEFGEDESRLDRAYGRVLGILPYGTLAVGWALSLAVSDRSTSYQVTTAGIVIATAAWVFLAFTRIGPDRENAPVRLTVYLFVMLALGAVLVSRDLLFFVFVITAFFHAGLLRPFALTAAAITGASFVVNMGMLEGGTQLIVVFCVVVVVQSAAIIGAFLIGDKITQLTAERQEALQAREEALEENAGLHMQLLTQAREAGVLDERQRLARDIHDTVAQGLAGIIAQLHAADEADGDDRRRHLDSAAELARSSLDEARRTVQAIGPSTLETAQLPEALAEEAAKWSAANGVDAAVTTTGDARPMHPEVEVTLLRTAQEALTNVRKHAEAGRVGLTLSYMDDEVALDVRDDGRGFDPDRVTSSARHGFGLAAMRQRVGRLAGSVTIESEPGGGTVVSANVPAIPLAAADVR